MKVVSFRALALASLASLAMATPSSAVTILQYGQRSVQTEVKVATVNAAAGTTTIVGRNPAGANVIQVDYSTLAGAEAPPNTIGEEVFNLTSTGDAVVANNRISQAFSGTITYYLGAVAANQILLQATLTNAVLSGDVGGSGASLDISDPPRQITFTSSNVAIQNLITANPVRAVAIGFTNLINTTTPTGSGSGLQITGTGNLATIAAFTANQAGTYSVNPTAVIPEPSGIVMAGMAMVAGLGCLRRRRRQLSRA